MTGTPPSVFDHSVRRTAAGDLRRFAALHDSRLVTTLEDFRVADARARELETGITDSLHELVSETAAAGRPALIALRRDIYNRRHRWLQNETAKEMVSEADSALSADLERLQRVLTRLQTITDQLTAQLGSRRAEEDSLLVQLSGQHDLAAALVLASPSVWGARDRVVESGSQKLPAKLMRSLFAYIQRGTLKPAPLSTFTALTVEGPQSPSVPPAAEAHVSVTAVRALVNALCTHEEFKDSFGFMPNSTLLVHGARATRVISPMYQRIEGQFNWRRDDVLHVELPEAVAHQALTLPQGVSGSKVEEHFSDTASLRFLVDTGIVLPLMPWHATAASPLAELVDALSPEHQVTSTLQETVEVVASLPISTPSRRIEIQGGVRQNLGRVFDTLGRVTPVFAQVRDVVRENFVGAAPAQSPEDHVELASTAAQIYREGLFRGVLHDALVQHTREIVGKPRGPVLIKDVPDVLAKLSYGAESVQRYQTTQMEEVALADQLGSRQEIAAARPVRITASTPPPIGMAIIHHVPAGAGVLDTLGAYGPGQFTRYLHGPIRTALADRLRRWASAMTPDGACLMEVTAATDQNDLQRDASGVWPSMKWPLDPHAEAGETELNDLMLAIDEDDAVTVSTRQGRPVQLMYVGAVPQALISGPVRNLLALASPWSFVPPDTSEFTPAPAVLEHPIVREREARNGLVLARRTLECEMSALPSSFLDGVTAQSLQELFAALGQWGFGQEVFVQLIPKMLSFAAAPKPSWVSCGSLSSLEALRHDLVRGRGRHHLRITEALPAVEDSIAAGTDAMTQTMHLLAGQGVQE